MKPTLETHLPSWLRARESMCFLRSSSGVPLSLEHALGYCDLSINAVAVNVADQRVLDPHAGRADINARVARLLPQCWGRVRPARSDAFRKTGKDREDVRGSWSGSSGPGSREPQPEDALTEREGDAVRLYRAWRTTNRH